jgi:hypothetical protein
VEKQLGTLRAAPFRFFQKWKSNSGTVFAGRTFPFFQKWKRTLAPCGPHFSVFFSHFSVFKMEKHSPLSRAHFGLFLQAESKKEKRNQKRKAKKEKKKSEAASKKGKKESGSDKQKRKAKAERKKAEATSKSGKKEIETKSRKRKVKSEKKKVKK